MKWTFFLLWVGIIGLFVESSLGAGPSTQPTDTQAARIDGGELIELNLPENLEISVLIEYVSKRLGLNIVYDKAISKNRVIISSPTKVPKNSLLGLLRSVLKMSGLMLVDAEQEGWKKVVPDKNLLAVTSALESDLSRLAVADATMALTQVFQLKHVSSGFLRTVVEPLLSKPGGNCFSVPDHRLLIVTDRADNLKRVATLVALVDKPGPEATICFVPVRHLEAVKLAKHVTELLQAKAGIVSRKAARPREIQPKLKLVPNQRTNQIAVISMEGSDNEAVKLIRSLDVPAYEPPSPIRFYKLVYATATDVLETIRALEAQEGGLSAITLARTSPADLMPKKSFVGPNRPPAKDARKLPKPPAYHSSDSSENKPKDVPGAGTLRVKARDAVVTVDTNTNTVIVAAPPAIQAIYAKLISMLDKRRPQVMIEVTLITLDTTDDFTLGVEIMQNNPSAQIRHMIFSSFGLSEIDTALGTMALPNPPGPGFNGIVIDAGTFSAVIRALRTCTRSDVLSAPKLLVNDNSTATLSSIAEVPFSSINASDTVATTSFAGYASAGTTLTIMPQISEGDHLKLQYSVTLNSFTGEQSDQLPPPRQTNMLTSEVTIPDGYAIIVGGLSREDVSESVSRIPFLGEVPVLEHLLSNRTDRTIRSTLFVFIRTTILRDDEFEDLKYLSDRDLKLAQLPPNLPPSQPQIMLLR